MGLESASLVVEVLACTGLVDLVQGLSCPEARGIFSEQGLNLHPLGPGPPGKARPGSFSIRISLSLSATSSNHLPVLFLGLALLDNQIQTINFLI